MTMIKKLALAGTVAASLAATPAVAAPYTAPSAAGTATVRLYDAITLTKTDDLDFGVVIDSGYAGGQSITMDAAGATDCSTVSGLSCTGSPTAAGFTIKGDSGALMSVSLTSADFDPSTGKLSLRNGANSLQLALAWSGMAQDFVLGNPTSNFSLTGTGANQTINLYGALAVKDSTGAPNGVYQSLFNLTADYQ